MVSKSNEPAVDKLVVNRISWLSLHDVTLSLFISKGDSRNHVSTQVNAEDGDCAQRQRNVSKNKKKEWRDFWDITCQSVGNGFLQVIKDQSTCGKLQMKHEFQNKYLFI